MLLLQVIKLENEVAGLRKKLKQQEKSYEDALKRKDEKLKKIEKQQADAITKQATLSLSLCLSLSLSTGGCDHETGKSVWNSDTSDERE